MNKSFRNILPSIYTYLLIPRSTVLLEKLTAQVRYFNITYYAALTVTGNDACLEADGPSELNFCSPNYYRVIQKSGSVFLFVLYNHNDDVTPSDL